MANIFSIFLLFGTWSLSFPLGKMMLSLAPPIFLTAIRMLFAALLLLGYVFFKKKFNHINRKILLSFVLLGFFNIYLTNVLEFWSLSKISAAKTCFLYSLSPFLTAFLSYIHFKEKMTKWKWIGLTIGFFGFIPTLLDKGMNEESLNTLIGLSWPEISMFFAVLFSVYGWVLLRVLVKEEVSPIIANGISMAIGGFLAFVTSFFIDTWAPLPISLDSVPLVFGLIAILTLLSNIFCYNLYGFLLKKYTATFLSLFGLLSPVFASLHGWVLLNEPPSPAIFLSTCIVILGLYLVYREEIKQGYTSDSALV